MAFRRFPLCCTGSAAQAPRDLMVARGTLDVDVLFEAQFTALAGHHCHVVVGIESETSKGADLNGCIAFELVNVALSNGGTLWSDAAEAFGLRQPRAG
jgi:hypothetical protein